MTEEWRAGKPRPYLVDGNLVLSMGRGNGLAGQVQPPGAWGILGGERRLWRLVLLMASPGASREGRNHALALRVA